MGNDRTNDDRTATCRPVASGCPVFSGTAVEVVDELFDLSDAEVDARLRELELHRRRLDAQMALTVAAAQQRVLYAADGHRSMKGYLRATCNASPGDVAAERRHAAGVSTIPGLADAWLAGRLSRGAVDALCRAGGRNRRIRTAVVECAPMLITLATEVSLDVFAEALTKFELLADPDGTEDRQAETWDNRDVRVINANGLLHLSAHGGDPIVNAELAKIFQQYTDQQFAADAATVEPGETLPRTAGQRRYDALVAVFRDALTANGRTNTDETDSDADVSAVTTPAPTQTGAGVIVDLLISEPIMAAALARAGLAPTDENGRPLDPFTGTPVVGLRGLLDRYRDDPWSFLQLRCETGDGALVHPTRVLQAALAGHMRRIVIDSRGVAVDMGRRQRVFSGPAREAIMLLNRRCDHPGCDLPADWCQIDHLTEWEADGLTDQDNGRPRCGPHNRTKHQERWRVHLDDHGRSHTIRTDGTAMHPVGTDPPAVPKPHSPPTPEEIAATIAAKRHKYRHLTLVPDTRELSDDERARDEHLASLGWVTRRLRVG